MKTLICAGDSYTDVTRVGNSSSLVWPNFLAEKIKAKHLINIGSSGAGNYEIFSRIVDEITLNKNIDLVVVMWSEFPRLDFELDIRTDQWPPKGRTGRADPYAARRLKKGKNKFPQNYMNIHPQREVTHPSKYDGRIIIENGKKKVLSGLKHRISFEFITSYLTNYYADVNKFMRYAYSLQSICENEHIPYIQIMGCEPIMDVPGPARALVSARMREFKFEIGDGKWIETPDLEGLHHSVLNHITDHHMFDNIKKNFIGWPIFQELDGYHIDNFLELKDLKWDGKQGSRWPADLRISEKDSHPNETGHKLIGELLYNEYKKIYPKD